MVSSKRKQREKDFERVAQIVAVCLLGILLIAVIFLMFQNRKSSTETRVPTSEPARVEGDPLGVGTPRENSLAVSIRKGKSGSRTSSVKPAADAMTVIERDPLGDIPIDRPPSTSSDDVPGLEWLSNPKPSGRNWYVDKYGKIVRGAAYAMPWVVAGGTIIANAANRKLQQMYGPAPEPQPEWGHWCVFDKGFGWGCFDGPKDGGWSEWGPSPGTWIRN